MQIFKLFWWLFTGCPLYFAGISAATIGAVAAGVSATAGVAGAVMSSTSAKKAGQTQYDAAKQAGATDAEAARQANEVATRIYNEDLARQDALYRSARSGLDPYASAGQGALNQLSSLTRGPTAARAAVAGRAASGTSPEAMAKLKAAQTAANAKREALNKEFATRQGAVGFDQAQAEFKDRINSVDREQQAANQAVMHAPAYDAGQAAQDAYAGDNGGELNRDFNAQDYRNDPTSGGNAPPDLTKNFDEQAWFDSQGKKASDLTANFDQAGFLAQGGHNIGDLTRDFDRTGYLANAGFTEADLARKFTANDFQTDPGYQFRIDQGNQGINNSAAARGNLLSGATMKALAKYNSGEASQEYGNAFNRFQGTQQQAGNALGAAQGAFNQNRGDLNNSLSNAYNRFGTDRSNLSNELGNAFNRFGTNRSNAANVYGQAFDRWTGQRTNQFNRLASLAGMGQTAATQQGSWAGNYANNASQTGQQYSAQIGNNTMGTTQRQNEFNLQGANAQAAGQIGSASAINQGMGQVGNALTQYAYLRQPTNYGGSGPGYRQFGNSYANDFDF